MRKVYFNFCIFIPFFFMGAHKITKCKMSPNIVPIVCLKNMNVMGSFISTFTKIASAYDSKLAKILIAYFQKVFCNIIYLFKTFYDDHNINNRLRR